jgi:hypothetical protein
LQKNLKIVRKEGEDMQSQCHLLNTYAKLYFTNLIQNKTWVTNGKGRGVNNLASEWVTGQNHDRKKIKSVDLLIKTYESVTEVQQQFFYSV